MAASVTVLWLIAAFLGGAFSLTCYQCNNTTGIDCNENEKPCEAKHDACITTLTRIRQDKTMHQQLVKACGEKKFCNNSYSMSFNSTRLYASITCCYSDKCKTSMPEIKAQDKEKENQQKCPYCSGPTSKCGDDRVSCFGEEKKCVSFLSKDGANMDYTWKGCTTENVCLMKSVATLPMYHVATKEHQCSHAPSLLPGLLLPSVFGLALLKLFL